MTDYEKKVVERLNKNDLNDPKAAANDIDLAINSFSHNYTEMAEALNEPGRENLRLLAFWWVGIAGSDNYARDGRNERTHDICSLLAKHCENLTAFSTTASSKVACGVAMQMCRTHRTLQQSFTGMLFSILLALGDKGYLKMCEAAGADPKEIARLPLI